MALKVKPKTLAEFSEPFNHIRAKKIIKIHFFSIWSLMRPSKNFFGLFHFFWDILCLGSLLGCSNPISKFNIIPKGKWFKFLVSNHSVLQNVSWIHFLIWSQWVANISCMHYGGFGMSPTKLTVGLSDWVSKYGASTLLRALHALYMPCYQPPPPTNWDLFFFLNFVDKDITTVIYSMQVV